MKIVDILSINSIRLGLQAENKKYLLERMLDLAMESGRITNREEAKKEVFEREKIMSTGIGKGIALPHAKTNSVSDSVASLAVLGTPIDYDAIDGKEVSIVLLLLGRESNVGSHLRLLSRISRLLNDDDFRQSVLDCSTPEELLSRFAAAEDKD